MFGFVLDLQCGPQINPVHHKQLEPVSIWKVSIWNELDLLT